VLRGGVEGRYAVLEGKEEKVRGEEGEKREGSKEGRGEWMRRKRRKGTASSCWSSP
jgi:hypothetical protein